MNKIILTGRLTKDPERGSSQKSTARFRIAVDRGAKRNGEAETDFFDVILFDKLAEHVLQYLSKGRLVAVSGSAQWRIYEKEGKKLKTFEVIAREVDFLDAKPKQTVMSSKSAPLSPSNPIESMAPYGAPAVDGGTDTAVSVPAQMQQPDFSGVPDAYDFGIPFGIDPFSQTA
jgi:single-strand DNA-binding protein